MKPILFSGPMVRAILDGRKTQTRRLIGRNQLQPSETPGYDWTFRGRAPVRSIAQQQRRKGSGWQDLTTEELLALCPYGSPGDRLRVRETFCLRDPEHHPERGYWYAATDDVDEPRWTPSIFMPRAASRITLLITDVRVQRLRDIGDEDATAEGVTRGVVLPDEDGPARVGYVLGDDDGRCTLHPTPRDAFAAGCDSIGPWASNPPVFAISFRKETTNG